MMNQKGGHIMGRTIREEARGIHNMWAPGSVHQN